MIRPATISGRWLAAIVGALWLCGGDFSHAEVASVLIENSSAAIQTKARALAERAAMAADAGQFPPELPEQAAELGIAAALACVEFLDDAHPVRRKSLHAVIAAAAVGRAWPREILRHYDPAALRLFYSPEGRSEQERLAACLKWNSWEAATPDVLVRAAPLPTLAWLESQALAPAPAVERLLAVWQAWGLWVRSGRELQHLEALREVIAKLAANRALVGEAAARIALAKFAGECRATAAFPFLFESLRAGATPEIRAAAAIALGRCGGTNALAALVRQTAAENDTAVLAKLAIALEAWPEDATAGAALLALFGRVSEPAVRRSILFAAIPGRWPQRSEIVLRGMRDETGGVAGVALQAVAVRTEPGARESVLALAEAARVAQPNLIDALGTIRDARAGKVLARWALAEANVSLQIKLVHALKSTGGADAGAVLVKLLKSGTDGLVVEHIILAIEELAVADAVPTLLALAGDRTAPIGVRLQAIRALGAFPRAEVREFLARLATRVETEFAAVEEGSARGLREERVEQARVYLAIARLRLGEREAGAEIARAFARGTATVRWGALQLLGALKLDHAVIREGLNSGDFAVLLAAVNAARRTNAASYRVELERLAGAPFIRALGQSGVDVLNFEELLAEAVNAARGGQR